MNGMHTLSVLLWWKNFSQSLETAGKRLVRYYNFIPWFKRHGRLAAVSRIIHNQPWRRRKKGRLVLLLVMEEYFAKVALTFRFPGSSFFIMPNKSRPIFYNTDFFLFNNLYAGEGSPPALLFDIFWIFEEEEEENGAFRRQRYTHTHIELMPWIHGIIPID